MTPWERVKASLDHLQPDKVPYCIGFTQRAYDAMVRFYGDPRFIETLGNALVFYDTGIAEAWQEIAQDVWQDEFGVQWNRAVDKDIGVVCNHAARLGALHLYRFPDPDDPRRWAKFPTARGETQDRFALANLGFSLFERAWTLVGMEDLLMAMVSDPGSVDSLLDAILEYNLAVIDRACSFAVDGMLFGDDWGSQSGVLMGPDLWRRFIKPRVREMYQAVRRKGKRVFIHSCGKVDELFPDLIECGLECFNPFQPEVMDVFDIKRRYGDRLCFYGGISTQKTLPYASPEQVREEVKRLLDVIGNNGGYIAAPAHAIPGDARPENVAAMLDVLRNQ